MRYLILFMFLSGCASTQVQQTQQNISETATATATIMGSAAMVVYSIRNFH